MLLSSGHAFCTCKIVTGNNNTNKLAVSNYVQVTDKKGNVRISYQAMGRLINAKI